MVLRSIVKIDEELCNGCGACISPCAEGALVLIDGKAKVIRDELCDGAGFCIGLCPLGALSLEIKETDSFSEQSVKEIHGNAPRNYLAQQCNFCNVSEDEAFLLPMKYRGESKWVCTRCLPRLIHG